MQRLPWSERGSRLALAAADGAVLLLAALTAAVIRFPRTILADELLLLSEHPLFFVYALGMVWALALTFDLYDPRTRHSPLQLALRVLAFAVSLPAAIALGVYMVPPWRFGRGLLAITVTLTVIGVWAVRMALASSPRTRIALRAVVVGDGPIVQALVSELRPGASVPFEIVDHVSADAIGDSRSLEERLATAELVILAQLHDDRVVQRAVSLNFLGLPVVDAAAAYAALTGRIPIQQVDSRWFVATGDFAALATTPFHRVQRLLDLLVASLLLLLSTPLMLLAALAIVLEDGPPVIYRQQRLGRFRKPFTLLKLRTMTRRAEADGPQFASRGDLRALRVGRWLRRWRIDEIPQLYNVLRGDMSLVGPRPERPELASGLESSIPFYAFRYSVKPGLTGWAQVNLPYCADPDDHASKVEFDLYYLRHHGPGMYTLILIRTLGALVFRPGW